MGKKEHKIKHYMYVPWTGLGLYGGFRGNRWLKNRIQVFKQFVVPSLLGQTNPNFTVWFSWRREERKNPIVQDFIKWMNGTGLKLVNTFHGVCFWDDKYSDEEARSRLLSSLHGSIGELYDDLGEVDYVYMTIQPSDDCYETTVIEGLHRVFEETDFQAVGFDQGYMCNYRTLEVSEYNPTTNPPFFTIKFPREIFTDPLKHAEYTGPYKSHEYIGEKLRYGLIHRRGFLVGTHGENISTVYDHPFRGKVVDNDVLVHFGLFNTEPLRIKLSIRKWLLRKLPHPVQKKLRYIFGERLYNRFYNYMRS